MPTGFVFPDNGSDHTRKAEYEQEKYDLWKIGREKKILLVCGLLDLFISANHPHDEVVEQLIDVCALEFRFARVLHEFRISSRKNHHAIAPLRVSQYTAS